MFFIIKGINFKLFLYKINNNKIYSKFKLLIILKNNYNLKIINIKQNK